MLWDALVKPAGLNPADTVQSNCREWSAFSSLFNDSWGFQGYIIYCVPTDCCQWQYSAEDYSLVIMWKGWINFKSVRERKKKRNSLSSAKICRATLLFCQPFFSPVKVLKWEAQGLCVDRLSQKATERVTQLCFVLAVFTSSAEYSIYIRQKLTSEYL